MKEKISPGRNELKQEFGLFIRSMKKKKKQQKRFRRNRHRFIFQKDGSPYRVESSLGKMQVYWKRAQPDGFVVNMGGGMKVVDIEGKINSL